MVYKDKNNHIITISSEINKEAIDILAEIIAFDILNKLETKREEKTNV